VAAIRDDGTRGPRVVPGSSLTVNFTGLTVGRGYRFQVSATNDFGRGMPSDVSAAVAAR